MSDIATSLISDEEREYLILKNRANTAADDGTYEWALNEIERLREALREIAEGDRLHFNNDEQSGVLFSVGHWGRVARAALGEGKE